MLIDTNCGVEAVTSSGVVPGLDSISKDQVRDTPLLMKSCTNISLVPPEEAYSKELLLVSLQLSGP